MQAQYRPSSALPSGRSLARYTLRVAARETGRPHSRSVRHAPSWLTQKIKDLIFEREDPLTVPPHRKMLLGKVGAPGLLGTAIQNNFMILLLLS